MNYVGKLLELDQGDYRLMARYIGHMLLMATEHMEDWQIDNMMMNQLNPYFVASSLDSAGTKYFDMP